MVDLIRFPIRIEFLHSICVVLLNVLMKLIVLVELGIVLSHDD